MSGEFQASFFNILFIFLFIFILYIYVYIYIYITFFWGGGHALDKGPMLNISGFGIYVSGFNGFKDNQIINPSTLNPKHGRQSARHGLR